MPRRQQHQTVRRRRNHRRRTAHRRHRERRRIQRGGEFEEQMFVFRVDLVGLLDFEGGNIPIHIRGEELSEHADEIIEWYRTTTQRLINNGQLPHVRQVNFAHIRDGDFWLTFDFDLEANYNDDPLAVLNQQAALIINHDDPNGQSVLINQQEFTPHAVMMDMGEYFHGNNNHNNFNNHNNHNHHNQGNNFLQNGNINQPQN